MRDVVLEAFLAASWRGAQEIVGESDCLEVTPAPGREPPDRFLCVYSGLEHLVRRGDGVVEVSGAPIAVGIAFPSDYLSSGAERLHLRAVTVLSPIFHPNLRPPAACLGAAFRVGTPLRDLLVHLYEILSYQNFTTVETDAFDPEACRYLRAHSEVVAGLKRRPFRRRALRARARLVEKGS